MFSTKSMAGVIITRYLYTVFITDKGVIYHFLRDGLKMLIQIYLWKAILNTL